MKKILTSLLIITAVMFSGCVTDGAYTVGKAVYKGGRVVVQELPISDTKREKLKKVDKYATTYDKARTAVRVDLKKDAD